MREKERESESVCNVCSYLCWRCSALRCLCHRLLLLLLLLFWNRARTDEKKNIKSCRKSNCRQKQNRHGVAPFVAVVVVVLLRIFVVMTSKRMRWSWCRVGFSSWCCCCCCWRCFYILIFRKTHTTNLCDAACRLALALLDLHWRRRWWWWLQSRGCVFFILFVCRVGGCCWWSTNEGTWEKSFSNKMWNTDCDVVKKQPSLTPSSHSLPRLHIALTRQLTTEQIAL